MYKGSSGIAIMNHFQAPHHSRAVAPDIAHLVGMAIRQAENHRFDQSLLHRSRDLGLCEDVRGSLFGESPSTTLRRPPDGLKSSESAWLASRSTKSA